MEVNLQSSTVAVVTAETKDFPYALILAAIIAMAGVKAEAREKIMNGDIFEKLSCDTIIREGWNKMPDVVEYISAKPGSDKLGYGSECHLGSLFRAVFSGA